MLVLAIAMFMLSTTVVVLGHRDHSVTIAMFGL
jgi:hypothetical protein